MKKGLLKWLPNCIRIPILIYKTRKFTKKLKKIYQNDDIIEKLNHTTGIYFKVDWVGRIYGIFNPYINIPKSELILNPDTREIDKGFIIKYLMERLDICSKFLNEQTLFDILTLETEVLDRVSWNTLIMLTPLNLYEDGILDGSKKHDLNKMSSKFRNGIIFGLLELLLLVATGILTLIYYI